MKLSLAYINDVHGYLEPHPELFFNSAHLDINMAGGYAKICNLINSIKEKNEHTLVFDGGDTFHGTLPLVASNGEAILPVLNKIDLPAADIDGVKKQICEIENLIKQFAKS